ncbi:TIR domain-containing protein [Inquilinus sp. Marseille-Q2685]|uniref:TIR domain-containing protein n=1 Tax=Inquilinus sp. Marseille-Q2685 TaxID=2866581 RepID=UPI001CE4794F|nr:TIR domain-containing protein [Inquilinus sp. Marseille-Q2685]
MIDRFLGDKGRRLRVDTMALQKFVGGDRRLAEKLADNVEMLAVPAGTILIEQGADDNDMYLIFSGTFDVLINKRKMGIRGPTDHIGEMAAIQPTQKRSATLIANVDAIVAKLTEEKLAEIATEFPSVYRSIAQELAKRLIERNKTIGSFRNEVRIFIISSAEARHIAQAVQMALAHEYPLTTVWTDGVFKVASYTIEALEAMIEDSDFAVAIAHADDLTESRGKDWPSPRDNVIFELGLFMGRLGRARAILMEPRHEKVKLPSDLTGITTITYRYEAGKDAATLLAPACTALRDHIARLGPYNG